MPKPDAQKEEVLARLRILYEQIDDYPDSENPDRPLEFSKQVKIDVDDIVKNGENIGITNWGATCRIHRERKELSLNQVANKLGVSHKAIQREENKIGSTTVNPFYLEAFSLIYSANPYDLLNKRPKYLICPFCSRIDPRSRLYNVIYNNLFDENDWDKLNYLKTITTIGKLREEKYRLFVSFLTETSSFKDIFNSNPLESKIADDDSRQKSILNHIKPVENRNTEMYQKMYILVEANLLLEDLMYKNPERLLDLARFSLFNQSCAKKLSYFVQEIGFPKDKKSLRRYDVDKLILRKSKGKKAQRYGK